METAIKKSISARITGPLRKNAVNPRYFATPEGKAVYLTGSHTWNNLQDKGVGVTVDPFDWEFYLDWLAEHNHNLIRLWADNTMGAKGRPLICLGAAEMPWAATGPGTAVNGQPKLDLTKFNEKHFERIYERVASAQERGIYVDIMLFEGCFIGVNGTDRIVDHPFAGGNNINGIDISLNVRPLLPRYPDARIYADWVTLDNPDVVRLQEMYVEKVIDTVNGFDNVIYEIANEPSCAAYEWQEYFMSFIRRYEAARGKMHMIGTPGGMKTSNSAMWGSSADWVSPDCQSFDDPRRLDYREGTITWGEAPYDRGDKVVILDTDHLWGLGGSADWAWRSFCRGFNVIYMDPGNDWPGGYFKGTKQYPKEPDQGLRREMGVIRTYAERMDLNHAVPCNDLCSSGYCMAQQAKTYLFYQPEDGAFTIRPASGTYRTEWHLVETDETVSGDTCLSNGEDITMIPPGPGGAVLLLERQ